MFSANSDEIVDVVEQGVGRYQTTVRPSLLDLLAFPAWFTKLFSSRRGTAAVFNEFDKAVDQLINSRGRQPNGQPKDLLARLVAARDADTGGGMTAKEVRDEVVTIFMAGHETTAQALTWTWYLLSLHPSAEAKLHEELTTALNGRTPQYEDIANLRYTRMVESMRLYPPAHTMAREPIVPDYNTWSPYSCGLSRAHCSLAAASQGIALGSAGSFQSRPIYNRACTVHLHSVWCGSSHLHWRSLCNDRDQVKLIAKRLGVTERAVID
jgi:Cytochrome P450